MSGLALYKRVERSHSGSFCPMAFHQVMTSHFKELSGSPEQPPSDSRPALTLSSLQDCEKYIFAYMLPTPEYFHCNINGLSGLFHFRVAIVNEARWPLKFQSSTGRCAWAGLTAQGPGLGPKMAAFLHSLT